MIKIIKKYSYISIAICFTSGVFANMLIRGEYPNLDSSSVIKKQSNEDVVNSILKKHEDLTIDKNLMVEPTPIPVTVKWKSKEKFISSGDSIYKILLKNGLQSYEIAEITSSMKKHNKELLHLKINDKIILNYKNDKLFSLDVYKDKINFSKIVLKNKENELLIYEDSIPTIIEKKGVNGVIKSSLYADGISAGLNDSLVIQLANIFAWDIDFSKDISQDDQFSLVYEQIVSGKKLIDTGNILGAVFKTKNKNYYAFRYSNNGKVGFYDEKGKNLEKAFIRSPVKFPRVTSKFNLKRHHPVLKINRPHKGVDYGGSLNTPIMSTGSGTIIERGKYGAYGNAVIVDHGQGYQTLYAHMNKFASGQSKGSKVNQGEVIGYMGKTGLVTGIHLHYEFRINGQHKDSLNLDLPNGKPIDDIESFKLYKDELIKIMEK